MKNPENNCKENVIEVEELTKKFGSMQVLNGLTIQLRRGENLVVLGKSGMGKSVLIKCIVRLLDPDTGKINVLGQDMLNVKSNDLNELRSKIGFLFQSAALYDSMTVRQNLEFPLQRIKSKLSSAEMETKIKEALENVGLPDAIDKMPSELSGGMRKRIGLARTIIVDPEIMLYDEPTTGLDPVTSHEISLLINDIQKKYKTSSIIITHDIECVRTVANRVIMLQEGKVYKEGTLEEFENSDDELIKSYFQSNNVTNLNKV
ncbi:ABC transporter ATP-binding protein [Flavobacterium sp. 3HN19-14]|uniref:ABC transporter ATP-binding protein n=1 Tax=Flavobacterium sp. 3HN19-14 TaxID=3448133 RepID=UPI003EE2D945